MAKLGKDLASLALAKVYSIKNTHLPILAYGLPKNEEYLVVPIRFLTDKT